MFTFNHFNINVLDHERSLKFYDEAFGLKPVREKLADDGSYKLIFLGDGRTDFSLELTLVYGRTEPYDIGEGEFHLAFVADDIMAAHEKHASMGCICKEGPDLRFYFVQDPDGYWVEIVRNKKL